MQGSRNPGSENAKMYSLGAIFALVSAAGGLLDAAIGTSLGGDLNALPRTAVERFAQIQQSPVLGLYCLDILNLAVQVLMILPFLALFLSLRAHRPALSSLAFFLFGLGTAVFVAGNAALPMLQLSREYAAAGSEAARQGIAGAGEALLAKGGYGSLGAFPAFFLLCVACLLMAFAQLKAREYPRATAYVGIAGNALMAANVVLVAIAPSAKSYAMALAAPGGLLDTAWLVFIAVGLFRSARRG
jgi:hypothetical protein